MQINDFLILEAFEVNTSLFSELQYVHEKQRNRIFNLAQTGYSLCFHRTCLDYSMTIFGLAYLHVGGEVIRMSPMLML